MFSILYDDGQNSYGKSGLSDGSRIQMAAFLPILFKPSPRPTMRFVEIKTPEQQSVLMLHRTRHLFVRQRTMLINALRAHLAEFGIDAVIGPP